jgi:hypothetical protein
MFLSSSSLLSSAGAGLVSGLPDFLQMIYVCIYVCYNHQLGWTWDLFREIRNLLLRVGNSKAVNRMYVRYVPMPIPEKLAIILIHIYSSVPICTTNILQKAKQHYSDSIERIYLTEIVDNAQAFTKHHTGFMELNTETIIIILTYIQLLIYTISWNCARNLLDFTKILNNVLVSSYF